jgi:glutaredoxin 3
MIFSKSYCPYCNRAKAAFDDMGVSFGAIELDKVEGGAEIQAKLLDMTGQRTVPNVWVKGKHLGGCDDTLAAVSSGKLKEMLGN